MIIVKDGLVVRIAVSRRADPTAWDPLFIIFHHLFVNSIYWYGLWSHQLLLIDT
jgi:hypothetical protein